MADRISFNEGTLEVIRIDQQGFHYRGRFIEDAGEAHQLLVQFLRQHQPISSGAQRTMADLFPATQAVLDALYMDELNGPQQLMARAHAAAALRAAADQVVPEFWHEEGDIYAETKHDVRADLLAIAAELENND